MAEPFIAEIRIFPYNFAPRNWAWCNGQTLAISQYTALFSIIGTIYGGDGVTTFGLPNLTGNMPVGEGSGHGLTPRRLGQQGGASSVKLSLTQIPQHTHAWQGANTNGVDGAPSATSVLAGAKFIWAAQATNEVAMSPSTIGPTGSGGAHYNMQPNLTLNYCIALEGLYPSRS